jgi:hypothetical protein
LPVLRALGASLRQIDDPESIQSGVAPHQVGVVIRFQHDTSAGSGPTHVAFMPHMALGDWKNNKLEKACPQTVGIHPV